ncbi:MAG TPA: efflux RND transporter periplasmic adaptor subunit [Opitutaceae bacterium]|nr:efflux RND transporter periplasmic adaptor subunit [Opitutaceae bacterium]
MRVIEVGAAKDGAAETAQYTGIVRARTESSLGFRVPGKIAERRVNAGDAVRKGQPLLQLDPVDYQLALQSARAAVEAARATHTQARLEQERVRVLVEKRAESRDALEKVDAAAESSAAQLRAAEAHASQIANQAGYTTLVADADGIVMTTPAEAGQVVSAGQTVIVLARDGPREAAVDIPEGSLQEIRHQAATARLYLDPAVTVRATLREVSGVADPAARTYLARYVLEGDQGQFPLGATVTIRVSPTGESARPLTEIPLGSLIDRGDGAAVWVVDPRTSALQRRAVTIAKLGAETALISAGLQHGDVIVSLGAQLLNSGEVVRMARPALKESP